MAFIVALTGGIGSGKSTVAEAFIQRGVPVVDADVIARQVVEPGTQALQSIVEYFGNTILTSTGQLDRAQLRELIFNDPQKKEWLNQLLHPLIQQETRRQLETISAPYVLWVVPLLIENQLQTQADRVLVVDVNQDEQRTRTLRRDGVSQDQIDKILAAQAPRNTRLSYAHDIIDNSGSLQELESQVTTLHQHYLELSASTRCLG